MVIGAKRSISSTAQHRPLAKPIKYFAHRYPDRREAMARAFQTGVYSMRELADHFGVHYSAASRAVRGLETGEGSSTRSASRPKNA